ncbi:MAG: TonB family protein [Hyphomonadaceae bacterium]
MFIWATRQASLLTMRALFYLGLFTFVVLLHVAVTSALRGQGWPGGAALAVSGALVLAVVLGANHLADREIKRRAAARDAARAAARLPEGPCCVVWRSGEGEAAMPWTLAKPLRAAYPPLAKRFGIEGMVIVDFEIGADGAAKHIHCVDAWPSDLFFRAAARALEAAEFIPNPAFKPRFGVSYRMPFVFRIAGAAALKDRGQKALPHRPALIAAVRAVEQLRKRA